MIVVVKNIQNTLVIHLMGTLYNLLISSKMGRQPYVYYSFTLVLFNNI